MTCECDHLRRQPAALQSKLQKQRNEIGRLTHQVDALNADKLALRMDLTKAQVRAEQMRAE